jgi:hypothetical protein
MISSRREVFQLAGASLASAAALSITERVPAQVPEEANSPSVTIVHKGINKELDIVNIDLLEASVLPEGIFVFIANGTGEQWTLRENRTDIAKALALGANAVAAGRAVWWSLTLGRAGGISALMDYFPARTRRHKCCTSASRRSRRLGGG